METRRLWAFGLGPDGVLPPTPFVPDSVTCLISTGHSFPPPTHTNVWPFTSLLCVLASPPASLLCFGCKADLCATSDVLVCARVCKIDRCLSPYHDDGFTTGQRSATGAETGDVARFVDCRLTSRQVRQEGEETDGLGFYVAGGFHVAGGKPFLYESLLRGNVGRLTGALYKRSTAAGQDYGK